MWVTLFYNKNKSLWLSDGTEGSAKPWGKPKPDWMDKKQKPQGDASELVLPGEEAELP